MRMFPADQGIVLTMYDARNNLSQQVEQDARDNLGELVFRTIIPRNVRVSERRHCYACNFI